MLLELRVDQRPRPLRVRIEAGPGATFAHLRAALALPETVQVGGSRLPDATPLGRPPLLDHAVLSDPTTSPAPARTHRGPTPEAALLRVYVLDGPDSGRVFPLTPGRHTLGRSGAATISLADPTLSRVHATLDVTGEGVSVTDCGSTNPGTVGGRILGAKPIALQPNDAVRLGQTRFEIRTPTELPATVRPDDQGHLIVHRPPRRAAPSEPPPIAFPTAPTESNPTRLPWLAIALPLVLAGLMAAVLRSPTMLLFGLMSPALVLGTWWQDRRSGRRTSRAARTAYRTDLDTAERRLADALTTEQVCRRLADPHPATVLDAARSRLSLLWDRDPADGLSIRIGTGRAPARTTTSVADREVLVEEVPIVLRVRPGGGFGVVGPRDTALRVARAALGAAVVRHGPAALHLTVAGDEETWGWTARLPHLVSVGAGIGTAGPRTLVVVDCFTAVGRQCAAAVPDGALVIALAPTRSALPAAATSVVELADAADLPDLPDLPDLHGIPEQVSELRCDGVSQLWAEELADALAPLREAPGRPGAAAIPGRARLAESLGLPDLVDLAVPPQAEPAPALQTWAAALTERWSHNPAAARLPLGVTATGPLVLDLDHDGPHFLVGGTTGSGKSEFLVSLVAAAAALNRPDEWCFVLVDYKGGAAFGACRDLPHVVGMVTDLDQHLAERALASLTAELRRRERLLAEHSCPDLATYRRKRTEQDPRIPRLVIVIDEFRSLADELPDLVQGLVRIAALGRSLGVHLVIATQRPGGAITADMRANLSGRIALRVRDAVDSLDVLGVTNAADLPQHAPGRAILASATTPITEFQTARVTAPVPDPRAAQVRVVSVDGIPLPVTTEPTDGPTDLDLLVAATRQATAALGATPPTSPWLPPLPTLLDLDALAEVPAGVALGLVDDPTQLAQRPWSWDPPDDGALAIVGTARSGRSSTLRTLAHRVTSQRPHPWQVYAVHTGALADLAQLPLCGASVAAADAATVDRLIDALDTPAPGPLRRLLLVDDWERLLDQLSPSGRVADRLQALVRDAADRHLDVAVAGGRALLTGLMAARFGSTVLLLPADPIDLTCAGVRPSQAPGQAPPGRAIDPKTGLLLQLAFVPPAPAGAVDGNPAEPPGHQLPTDWAPRRVRSLPSRVSLASLPTQPGAIVIGTDGDRPVALRPGNGSRRLVVVGSPGAGRSTALRTIETALSQAGMPVALLSTAPPDGLPRVSALRHDQVDELIALRRSHPDLAVLVDDAHRCDSGPIDEVLREIARLVDEDQGFLVLATTPQHSTDAVTSLAGALARNGEVLLLGALPPGYERVCGITTPIVTQAIPGRGHLVRHGIPTPVQVALPEGVSPP